MIAAATGAGALGAKICGAGGGGCLALLVEDASDRQVLEAVADAGGAAVGFRPDARGLTLA